MEALCASRRTSETQYRALTHLEPKLLNKQGPVTPMCVHFRTILNKLLFQFGARSLKRETERSNYTLLRLIPLQPYTLCNTGVGMSLLVLSLLVLSIELYCVFVLFLEMNTLGCLALTC